MRLRDVIYEELRLQRAELIKRMKTADFAIFNEKECIDWLESMIFSEDDIVCDSIKGFCLLEDIDGINDFRDYQHETIDLCIEEFNKFSA